MDILIWLFGIICGMALMIVILILKREFIIKLIIDKMMNSMLEGDVKHERKK